MSSEPIIIAIDGPSGVGKSTVARGVARRLELPYLETGAMYRALGWKIVQEDVDPEAQVPVEAIAATLELELEDRADGSVEVLLEGQPLDADIRLPRVSEVTSVTSSYPAVRRRMVALQRHFAQERGAVMEGRDIGTRVFPDTPHKFFLTAPLEIRVQRRMAQLEQTGQGELSLAAIEVEVANRDKRDSQRQESPLTLDSTYTVVETGELTAEQAIEVIVAAVAGPSPSPDGGC